MGTEIGQFAENTVLFEAACSHDPVLRLAGVNRALEGLAIDVFTTMKEFGDLAGDPYLEFCEDWMLADEVTHVKMGSDWLRRVTEKDPERRKKALEFQSVVDKLFSYGGPRSDSEESPSVSPVGSASWPASPRRGRRDRRLSGGPARGARTAASAAREAAAASAQLHDGHCHPAEFNFVDYDAGADRGSPTNCSTRSPPDRDVRDRGRRDHADRAHPRRGRRHRSSIRAESGAFEDTRRPRQQSETPPRHRSAGCCCGSGIGWTAASAKRPPDDDLTLAQVAAWDTYSVGRLERLGYRRQPAALALQLPQPPRLHRRVPTRPSTSCGPATA